MVKTINSILHLILAILLAFLAGRAFISVLLIWGINIPLIARVQFILSNIFVGFLLFIIIHWIIDKLKEKGDKHGKEARL